MNDKKDYLDAVAIVGKTMILVPAFLSIISLIFIFIFGKNIEFFGTGEGVSSVVTFNFFIISGLVMLGYVAYKRFMEEYKKY